MSRTNLRYAALQLWHPLNCNYLPYGRGIFKQKKTEAMKEFEELHGGTPLEWWDELSRLVVSSGCAYPVDQAEADALAECHLHEHPDVFQSGPGYRLTSWYSIIPALKAKDKSFPLWRRFLRWLALALLGNHRWSEATRRQAEKEAEAEVAKAATNAETKEQHQSRLKQLRRVTGNSLLLGAILLHNENYFCARLILAVGDLLYQEQTYKSQHKRSPGADALWMCNVAHGAGPSFLKNIWRHVTQDRQQLAKLGVSIHGAPCESFDAEVDPISGTTLPGVASKEIPQRIMNFLCTVIELRLISYTWLQESYPHAFAGWGLNKGGVICVRGIWVASGLVETDPFCTRFPVNRSQTIVPMTMRVSGLCSSDENLQKDGLEEGGGQVLV